VLPPSVLMSEMGILQQQSDFSVDWGCCRPSRNSAAGLPVLGKVEESSEEGLACVSLCRKYYSICSWSPNISAIV
jgi:hypothetical protein